MIIQQSFKSRTGHCRMQSEPRRAQPARPRCAGSAGNSWHPRCPKRYIQTCACAQGLRPRHTPYSHHTWVRGVCLVLRGGPGRAAPSPAHSPGPNKKILNWLFAEARLHTYYGSAAVRTYFSKASAKRATASVLLTHNCRLCPSAPHMPPPPTQQPGSVGVALPAPVH